MNRDMLMAGLEHFSSPKFDPNAVTFVYTEEIGPDHPQNRSGRNRGDQLQHLLPWHSVAEAALARIEALEKAEWFATLPHNEQWRHLMDETRASARAQSEADRILKLNLAQAAEIQRLQKELDAVMGASRV